MSHLFFREHVHENLRAYQDANHSDWLLIRTPPVGRGPMTNPVFWKQRYTPSSSFQIATLAAYAEARIASLGAVANMSYLSVRFLAISFCHSK